MNKVQHYYYKGNEGDEDMKNLTHFNARQYQSKMAKKRLQIFADDGGGEPGGEPGGAPKTYTQAELDKAIADAKAAAKADNDRLFNEKWDKKYAKYKEEEQKKIDEAKRLAEMSAQEKAEHERDELQKELDALKKAATLTEMKAEARRIMKEANTPINEDMLDVLVTTDAEKTKKAITGFTEAFNKAVEDAVKAALKGDAPKKGTGAKITKEEILKVKDRKERQRLINENMELFA